jgi:hypothetical protein
VRLHRGRTLCAGGSRGPRATYFTVLLQYFSRGGSLDRNHHHGRISPTPGQGWPSDADALHWQMRSLPSPRIPRLPYDQITHPPRARPSKSPIYRPAPHLASSHKCPRTATTTIPTKQHTPTRNKCTVNTPPKNPHNATPPTNPHNATLPTNLHNMTIPTKPA